MYTIDDAWHNLQVPARTSRKDNGIANAEGAWLWDGGEILPSFWQRINGGPPRRLFLTVAEIDRVFAGWG